MFRRALIGAVLLVGLLAAPASAQYVDIVISPTRITPGGQVTVTGKACLPGETVKIYLVPGDQTASFGPGGSTTPTGTLVATIVADGAGNFTVMFTVPPGTKLGTYTVLTDCGGSIDAQLIEVLGQSAIVPPGTPPSGGSTALPRTGSNLNGLGLTGAGLLAAGGLVLIAVRRRRNDQRPTLAT